MSAMNYQKAGRLMGSNFFGPREWEKFYGVKFTKNQLDELWQFPWSEETLNAPCPFCNDGNAVKDCHFALLGISRIQSNLVNLRYLQQIHPREKQPRFNTYDRVSWYLKQPFANTTVPERWYLIHLHPLPYTMGKTYPQQVELLSEVTQDYEVPPAVILVKTNLFFFRRTGSFPKNSDHGRVLYRCCDSILDDSISLHPVVGTFGKDGICIGGVKDSYSDPRITIAASRLPK